MDLTSGLLHQVGGNNKEQMELLDELVTSRKFIGEPCVNSIISKSINLGFRWDIIKEVFKETLSQFLSQHIGENHHRLITPTFLASIDLKQVFGAEERVIERILYASIQAEQQQSNTGNNNNDLMTGSELDSFHPHQQQQQHQSHPLTAMSLGPATTLSDEPTSMFPTANPDSFYDMDHQMQQFLYQQRQIHQQIQKNTTVYKAPGSQPPPPQQHLSAYLQSLTGSGMNKLGGGNTSQMKIPPSPQELIARANDKSNLRPIIIDGNDVGLSSHSNKQMFSFGRICRAVDYFEKRNHAVFVLLPSWRKEQIMMNASTSLSATSIGSNSSTTSVGGNSNSGTGQQVSSGPAISPTSSTQAPVLNVDQEALLSMEDRGVLYCTPSKRVGNKHIICNDDKMILNFALNKDGIIVSNDNFKKYMNDSEGYKQVIEERVLMYSFIDDTFMPVEDPLGKNGPTLDNFLRFESIGNPEYQKRCPYKKRCTYGLKCKYWHPERDPEAMGNPMLNIPVRSSSTHQQPMPQQQQSLHHIANLSQLPISMHSQQQQQFKTVNQNMHDRIQEQKLVLEQILSKQSESVSFFEENGNKFGAGYFAQKTQPGEIDLRTMGPETTKTTSFVSPHQQMQYQPPVQTKPTSQNLSNLNKQMIGMSLGSERSMYNPIVGSTYMPSFNATSLMSQQNTQFSEVDTPSAVGSRPIVSSNSTESPSPSPNAVADQSTAVANNTVGSESSSEETTETKQSRQLTPNSLRQRLASVLNEEQIELFMTKYKDVRDETEAMFLASTWTIKQSFDF